GLQDTSRGPLHVPPPSVMLTSRLNRLRTDWQQQDDAAKVYGGPVPIIDSGLLVKADFRTQNAAADPALALFSARRSEITALVKQIHDLRKSKSNALAGFEAVVAKFVGKVETLTSLLADHQAGKDIVPRLTKKRLSLGAFL